MATYFEVIPPAGASPKQVYQKIAGFLIDNYSVEVVTRGDTVVLRVWETKHCLLGDHERIVLSDPTA